MRSFQSIQEQNENCSGDGSRKEANDPHDDTFGELDLWKKTVDEMQFSPPRYIQPRSRSADLISSISCSSIVRLRNGSATVRRRRRAIAVGRSLVRALFCPVSLIARNCRQQDVSRFCMDARGDDRPLNEEAPTFPDDAGINGYRLESSSSGALPPAHSTQTTCVGHPGPGSDEMSLIERVREDHSTVASVNLCGKTIGAKGAESLAAALKDNGNVNELRLACSGIGDEGVESLANVLRSNSTISKLCLRRNSITDAGAEALAKALGERSSVKCLTLAQNKVGHEGAIVIGKALRSNNTIAELDLSGNSIGIKGATEIARSLANNSTLEVVKLDHCDVGTLGATEIAEALHQNQTLAKLYLRFNNIIDAAEIFVEALRFNETLTRLDLSGNGFNSDEILARLEQSLEQNKKCVSSGVKPWTPVERNRICVLFSDPLVWRDSYNGTLHPISEKLELNLERKMLRRCIKESQSNIQLSYDIATVDRLEELAAARCGCLHFSGHGLQGNFGASSLMFEDRSGGAHFVSRDELSKLLCHQAEPFKVVFVSACHSLSIGHAFIDAGAKHVVCCEQDSQLDDSAACEFARAFYGSLVRGHSVATAFDCGRGAVSVRNTHEEAKKFVLLPDGEDHEVPVFDACCKKVPNKEEDLSGGVSIPAAPAHFVGRESAIFSVLNALLSERLVTVVGPRGIGLSSLTSSACQYLNDRLRSFLTIDSIVYVHRNRASKDLDGALLTPLYKQLVRGGKIEKQPGNFFSEECVCDALSGMNALVVFDDARGLEDELHSFLRTLFEKVDSVTVLLAAGKQTGFSCRCAFESVVRLDPLVLRSAADLFIKRCHYADTLDEKDRLRDVFLSEPFLELPVEEVNKRVRSVVRVVAEGVPSAIIEAATTLSWDEYTELMAFCP